jgi:hypothetical protein
MEVMPMMRFSLSTAIPLAALLGLGACANFLAEWEPARETVCVQTARYSLLDAVAAAERQGGRAIDAHYHQSDELGCLTNRPGRYEVTLLTAGRLESVAVDARTGETSLLDGSRRSLENFGRAIGSLFAASPSERARLAPAVRIGLPDAVALAGQASGKVLKVALDGTHSRPGYSVTLVERGRTRTIWVDGNSDPTILTGAYEVYPRLGLRGVIESATFAVVVKSADDEILLAEDENRADEDDDDDDVIFSEAET